MHLPIIHWNDVYRVSPQKISPKSQETIDVTQFAAMVDGIRNHWPQRPDGERDGLVVFSGDLFSPSVESSVTRGSHMVPVMNELAPDVSLTGNHDFDFGYPHLTKLIRDCTFPWILSNIVDTTTNKVPAALNQFRVFERCGIRIGVIGLVEKEWIATVASWPSNFKYRDMKETGLELSSLLRDPDGEYKCDLVIALTHSRLPNDVALAKKLLALSPSAQATQPIHNLHGIDIILGGHDHLYYVSKGVTSWENFDTTQPVLGAEDDQGNILVVKSGSDFRDLSEVILQLERSPTGSVRNVVIKAITGRRHCTKPGSPSSSKLTQLLKTILSSVGETLKAPVCKSAVVIDVRSQFIRTAESAACNWIADILRHAYDDAPCLRKTGSDGVLICAGTFRGDSVYGPGNVTLGDILEILPWEDPVIVLELDGAAIWDALEAGLSMWPAQEGRFPVVSGFRVSWDSRRPAGQRILNIWLTKENEQSSHSGSGHSTPTSGRSTPRVVDDEPIQRVRGGRKYKIVTREYMAQGHDEFIALKGNKYLVDDESGQMMSSIVRKYLMGAHFVNKLARQEKYSASNNLHHTTDKAVMREKRRRSKELKHRDCRILMQWKHAASLALRWSRSPEHYQDQLKVCATEHMSPVDAFDGEKARAGKAIDVIVHPLDDDLLVVSPEVDGRLKNEGRAN